MSASSLRSGRLEGPLRPPSCLLALILSLDGHELVKTFTHNQGAAYCDLLGDLKAST